MLPTARDLRNRYNAIKYELTKQPLNIREMFHKVSSLPLSPRCVKHVVNLPAKVL